MTCPTAFALSEDLRAAAYQIQPHQSPGMVLDQQRKDKRYSSALTRYKMHRRQCPACREEMARNNRLAMEAEITLVLERIERCAIVSNNSTRH